MKRTMLLLLILVAVALSACAAGEHVIVLYHGRSEVNYEALRYLQMHFGPARISMDVTNDPTSIHPGAYDSVIALSTGYTSGLDPVIGDFVSNYAAPREVIVVSLLSRTDSVFVDVTPASQSQYGVDAVSSASTWASRRNSARSILAMHDQWTSEVVSLVTGRNA